MEGLSTTIKQLRTERKLTQSDLANDLEVTQPYIASMETGKRTPGVSLLAKIADYFDMRVEMYGTTFRLLPKEPANNYTINQ